VLGSEVRATGKNPSLFFSNNNNPIIVIAICE